MVWERQLCFGFRWLDFQDEGTIEFIYEKNSMGLIIETPSFDSNLSAVDNLRWVCKVYGCKGEDNILPMLESGWH